MPQTHGPHQDIPNGVVGIFRQTLIQRHGKSSPFDAVEDGCKAGEGAAFVERLPVTFEGYVHRHVTHELGNDELMRDWVCAQSFTPIQVTTDDDSST